MQKNYLLSSHNNFYRKSTLKTIAVSLFLGLQFLEAVQGADVCISAKNGKDVFEKRNNLPYTLKEIKMHIDPVLDKQIEKEFWQFIEVMFDERFEQPTKHSQFQVFQNWNCLIRHLSEAKTQPILNNIHPQMQCLYDILVWHQIQFSDYDRKYGTQLVGKIRPPRWEL